MSAYERREFRHYKTKKAAESNAQKLTAEFKALGLNGVFVAVDKRNGYWTIAKANA
jgi:hypothetical protein